MKKIGLIILVIFLSGFVFLRYLSAKTNRDFFYFPRTLIQAIRSPTLSPNFNLLILGLDYRDDWLEKTQTTDTLILANIGNNVKLISLPRDLWDEKRHQKINILYEEALATSTPFSFLKENFQRITGQKIDRILVLTTNNLVSLIDLLGGVDVNLDQGFEDTQYPNPEYIKNPSAKTPIYITVKYPAGLNHLSGQNILPFVRSRKNANTSSDGGTDLGRIKRQQLLLESLLAKIKNLSPLSSRNTFFALYNYYTRQIQTDLNDTDLFSLAVGYRQVPSLQLQKIEIPIGINPKTDIIYDPQKLVQRQWVFLPQDRDFKSLHQFISQHLNGQ